MPWMREETDADSSLCAAHNWDSVVAEGEEAFVGQGTKVAGIPAQMSFAWDSPFCTNFVMV